MTPEKEKALKDEAAEIFKPLTEPDHPIFKKLVYDIIEYAKEAYIAGATSEAEKNESNAELIAERNKELVEALRELVYLKSIKDIPEYKEDYERRKPVAWAEAKRVIGEYNSNSNNLFDVSKRYRKEGKKTIKSST